MWHQRPAVVEPPQETIERKFIPSDPVGWNLRTSAVENSGLQGLQPIQPWLEVGPRRIASIDDRSTVKPLDRRDTTATPPYSAPWRARLSRPGSRFPRGRFPRYPAIQRSAVLPMGRQTSAGLQPSYRTEPSLKPEKSFGQRLHDAIRPSLRSADH